MDNSVYLFGALMSSAPGVVILSGINSGDINLTCAGIGWFITMLIGMVYIKIMEPLPSGAMSE